MTPQELSAKVGGYLKVAKMVGIKSHTAVMRWKNIPDHHLIRIEAETGIPREKLRPDLYERAPTTETKHVR